jgi:3-isopropylmalate/(R)-2-methylmalate dehydratase small subunit
VAVIIKGRVWKYGDDVNTDVIFPGKYTYTLTDRAEMGEHALEDLDPDFHLHVKPGDVIVAGSNFGCGSSREQAVTCLLAKQVGAVVAKSFARIYYRNCINNALPALVCPEAVEALSYGDRIEINLRAGKIYSAKGVFTFHPLPETVMAIFEAGGLIPYTRRKLGIEE